jgi:thioredoxin-dependent peroxiredoxin
VIAISTDDVETSKKFRDSLKAPYHFVADEKAVLVKSFDVKVFIFTLAKRVTFVVGPGRKILSISEGSDAIDPSGAVTACSIKPPESLKFITGGADARFEFMKK